MKLVEIKYEDIKKLIKSVESKDDPEQKNDIGSLTEEMDNTLKDLTISSKIITDALITLKNEMKKRIESINRYSRIKDVKLRGSKMNDIFNIFSNDLTSFNECVEYENPIFDDKINSTYELCKNIIDNSTDYNGMEKNNFIDKIKEFRDTLEEVMHQSASLLQSISNWPPVNINFNKSKRITETVINSLIKSMLKGIESFDIIL